MRENSYGKGGGGKRAGLATRGEGGYESMLERRGGEGNPLSGYERSLLFWKLRKISLSRLEMNLKARTNLAAIVPSGSPSFIHRCPPLHPPPHPTFHNYSSLAKVFL